MKEEKEDFIENIRTRLSCPLCGKPSRRLVYHHWIEDYRTHIVQICDSCNSVLGKIFKGEYPNWTTQVEKAREYFEEYSTVYKDYPKVIVPEYEPKSDLDKHFLYFIKRSKAPAIFAGEKSPFSLPPKVDPYTWTTKWTVKCLSRTYTIIADSREEAKSLAAEKYLSDVSKDTLVKDLGKTFKCTDHTTVKYLKEASTNDRVYLHI